MRNICLLGLAALSGCASLRAVFSSRLPESPLRVEELGAISLTEEPGPHSRGSFATGERQARKAEVWQWRGNWAVGAGQQSFTAPIFLGGNDVLVVTLGGGIELRDLPSGIVRWSVPVPIGVAAQPVILGASVVVAGMDSKVRRLRLASGEEEWQARISAESLGGVAAAQGVVYVTTGDDGLWALDEKTGNTLWTYKRPTPSGSVYWSLRGNAIPLISPDGKRVYAGFSDGTYVALESISGHTLWERHFERSGRFRDADTTAALAADGSTLYLPLVDGDLLALKTSDGATVWSVPGGGAATPLLNDADKTLVYATGDGRVQKISTLDTKVQWSTSLGARGNGSQPVALGPKFLGVSTTHAGLVILDAGSGKLLWERDLGTGTLAPPAFDGRRMLLVTGRNRLLTYRLEERKGG